jgi:TRAP-type mannitol/chloroaromatic compound transport system permease large subunit
VKKEVWFGLSIMALVVIGVFWMMPPPSQMTNGHLGLLMLAMIVVSIMLGFPTAFTLMGMGTMFTFFFYYNQNPGTAVIRTLDLMVHRAYAVMYNDVLIAVPLFVFMGYLVERANLIEKLFKGLHLATSRIPGSLAVATIVTCAVFATATGIIGAVVTLMGLLAFPAMLKAGYNVRLAAGSVTAGGTLGILIPPSVLLILYGATAGVSVVKLYAGAFFPGLILAGMYIGGVIIYAKIKPSGAPPLAEKDRRVALPEFSQLITRLWSANVMAGLARAIKGPRNADVPMRTVLRSLIIALLPALAAALLMGSIYLSITAPEAELPEGLVPMGSGAFSEEQERYGGGLQEPDLNDDASQPAEEESGGLQEPEGAEAPPETPDGEQPSAGSSIQRKSAPTGFWVASGIILAALVVFYAFFTFV